MAFDGSVVCGIAHELNHFLKGGFISKISQPEKDALILLIKNNGTQYRLFLSASASLPLLYITEENKKSPLTAPNFCMLLRKHLGSGRILEISSPSLERIIQIKTEHLDEMGDLSKKTLIIELMGKYSNIILTDENNKILDGIKHVTAFISSVREVLPNKDYFIPEQEGKKNPFLVTEEEFYSSISAKATSVFKAVYQSFIGFSPILANEICFRAGIDADFPSNALELFEKERLFSSFQEIMNLLEEKTFSPTMYLTEEGKPVDFSAFPLRLYANHKNKTYPSFSSLLEEYYGAKESSDRIRQKSSDLRKIISNAIERVSGKIDIFRKQLRDTDKKEKFRLYGELITTYGYQAKDGDKFLEAIDYNTGNEVKIPLETDIPVMANAKKYFDKYARLKRTFEAVSVQLEEAESELIHLDSIRTSLAIATGEEDLSEIREELVNYGYLKKKTNLNKKGKKEKQVKGKPLHFLSSDGFDIYVGKNNYQNDYITFKLAEGNDWWFHAKKRPGSHVVLVTNGREVPDRTFEEAGRLAIHYSSANTSSNVDVNAKFEVDYVRKKEVKKPNGAKPGFVVYYTNYSLIADSDISMLKQL